jgi:hypothetical protein
MWNSEPASKLRVRRRITPAPTPKGAWPAIPAQAAPRRSPLVSNLALVPKEISRREALVESIRHAALHLGELRLTRDLVIQGEASFALKQRGQRTQRG